MKGPKKNSSSRCLFVWLTVLNVALFSAAFYTYLSAHRVNADAISFVDKAKSMIAFSKASTIANSTVVTGALSSLAHLLSSEDPGDNPVSVPSEALPGKIPDVLCDDSVWCSIPMPAKSLFKFDAPTDERRWRIAQAQAASGEQVLLERASKVFPNPFNFLDGDKSFRKLHDTVDVFFDSASDFQALLPGGLSDYKRRLENREKNVDNNYEEQLVDLRGEYSQALEKEYSENSKRKLKEKKILEGAVRGGDQSVYKRQVVPAPYDFRGAKRAAVLQIGYIAFHKDAGTYFAGDFKGGVFITRPDFLKHWAAVKEKIDTPFVAMCVLNENWGFLSTMFPNRTAGWGKCCDKRDAMHKNLYDFLDHKKTLMLVVGQHHNISHPKVITVPRGLPLTW